MPLKTRASAKQTVRVLRLLGSLKMRRGIMGLGANLVGGAGAVGWGA